MRRVSGFVLTLLGAFLLVLAVLLRFWVVPSNTKVPLNEYRITSFTGTGQYLSPATGQEMTRVSVRGTTTTKGDLLARSGSTAGYSLFTNTQDLTQPAGT